MGLVCRAHDTGFREPDPHFVSHSFCIPAFVKSSSLPNQSDSLRMPQPFPAEMSPERSRAGQGSLCCGQLCPGVTQGVPSQHCHCWTAVNSSCLQKTLLYPLHLLLCYSTTNSLYWHCYSRCPDSLTSPLGTSTSQFPGVYRALLHVHNPFHIRAEPKSGIDTGMRVI